MRCRVYLWKTKRAVSADIVQDVNAQTPTNAIAAVMVTHHLTSASYVWVASHGNSARDVHEYNVTLEELMQRVSLPTAPARGRR